MVTGVTNIVSELTEKYVEMLLAAAPKLRRVGFLWDPTIPNPGLFKEAARRSVAQHAVEARFAEATRPEEIEAAISRLEKEGARALVVLVSQMLLVERRGIVKLALAHRWPMIAGQREWADDGALLSYGADPSASFRRAATYVDRILKGAKPGDLPIEQPTKFELVVNMKTAKALGITMPQSILVRADKVIE
jgi:putative ABC transport system substrate-binding protein